MPIKKRTFRSQLNLKGVDEVIEARQLLHGGKKGAPKKGIDNTREGAALNRAAMVMLAASLEDFIKDEYERFVRRKFKNSLTESGFESFFKASKPPRTTDLKQVEDAFLRIGHEAVVDGLSWQKCANATVRKKFREINQIRNRAAHGAALQVDQKDYNLNTSIVIMFRDFAKVFGEKFPAHLNRLK